MPALIPILSLLRNPWILLVIACAIGAGGTGWYRMQWIEEVSARAADNAAADQAALAQIDRDREDRARIDKLHEAKVAKLQQQVNSRESAINAATPGGPLPDPYRAYYDSVRREQQDKAGDSQTGPR